MVKKYGRKEYYVIIGIK